MATALPLVALLVAGCAALASATTFTVGGSQGWTTGVNYDSWANDKSFAVGDTLGELQSFPSAPSGSALIRLVSSPY